MTIRDGESFSSALAAEPGDDLVLRRLVGPVISAMVDAEVARVKRKRRRGRKAWRQYQETHADLDLHKYMNQARYTGTQLHEAFEAGYKAARGE